MSAGKVLSFPDAMPHFAGRSRAASLSLLVLAAAPAARPVEASSDVKGETVAYTSPGGVPETCVALAHAPGGVYSELDLSHEQALCAADFYGKTNAICPKLLSTSPGSFVYDVSAGPYAGNPPGFERTVCPRGEVVVKEAEGPPASFKMSVNGRGTSATYSTSSLVYYHFSRYFDAVLHVPVSVYRSMDRDQHLQRVTRRGLELSADRPALAMNHAAWSVLEAAELRPESYAPTDELFTADRRQVWGILLHVQGRRYGPEFDGTRQSGWGVGQSRDFEETAPFRALSSEKPLLEAITDGVKAARLNPALARVTPADVSPAQMTFWMRAITEIALLDHIFSQQDRIGNIDSVPYWYWVEGGELKSVMAEGETPPPAIASFSPKRIGRTRINDNDAGVRPGYANFAKEAGMLAKLRHFRAATYRRLIALDRDLAVAGPLREYLRTTFGLTKEEREQAEGNARDAAAILRASCKGGQLRFDLEAEELLRTGAVTETRLDCDNP